MKRPTMKMLLAMEGAVMAMLAGEVGEGDWPEGVSLDDMDEACSWIIEQMRHAK